MIGFIFIWNDKRRAIYGKWRIKESTLWLIAVLGGSLFMQISMSLFRHKTRHLPFRVGMPLISLIHILIIFFLFFIN